MKKSVFVNLLIGVVGGLLFSIGMCMCLLPEWDMFREGVVATAIGAVILAALLVVNCFRYKKHTKTIINWKLVGKLIYAGISVLVLGVGMCLIMVWEQMLIGIAVGIAGIVMLLCLIPMFVGLK